MNRFKVYIRELPILGRLIYKSYNEIRTLKRKLLLKVRLFSADYDIPNPEKTYWIDPEKIVYHTDYGSSNEVKENVFDMIKDRGAVYDGDWDISNFRFKDLKVYKAIKKYICEDVPIYKSEFYEENISHIQSGNELWGCENKMDFDIRIEYLENLILSIQKKGYIANKDIDKNNPVYNRGDEVTANIGRNGDFLFQDGRHRLAIAKLLGIKKIPIQILVRHQKWIEFREFVRMIAEGKGASAKEGYLYQPLLHPDLQDIPAFHDCENRFQAIKKDLTNGNRKGKLLDLGANLGYFSFKFEAIGFDVTAVENNSINNQLIEKVQKYRNSKFEIINDSILNEKIINKLANNHFNVVLALNLFHHFLKTKEKYEALKYLLKKLNVDVMYFEPHSVGEEQMKGAYIKYTEGEFIDFIFSYSVLDNKKKIYQANDGRNIYKLYT